MARYTQQSLRKAIGRRLREVRTAAGISSQEQLAHLAGVHRTYIGRLERGESGVTLETLAAVLAPMSVTLAQFFRPFKQIHRPRTPRRRE
jgi:transcriptional regulator with XRE-family HTH domain